MEDLSAAYVIASVTDRFQGKSLKLCSDDRGTPGHGYTACVSL